MTEDRKFFNNQGNAFNQIILVDRGNCSDVAKVRNIQNMGAAMAIIIDNIPENMEDVIPANDGTGSSINIPSFVVSKY